MKKLLLFCWLVLSAFTNTFAQSNTLNGSVTDEKNAPLPFANVLLMNTDSTLAKATTTDLDGKFSLESLKAASYFLRISMVGYQDYATPLFELSENTALPAYQLLLASNQLAEVKVMAKKPFIEQQIDKTVVNVEGSIVAAGNTLLEVLEKSPGIVLDRQNNNIKLKNKDGVLVMIDGRKNYLSAEALFQFLSNLNADQVASIEIITNPSSKYDAAGNSGIINIKLKKNQNFGTNGSVVVSAGQVFLPNSVAGLNNENISLSLNHRKEKLNIFGNFSTGKNAFYSDNTLMRSTNFEGLRSQFDQGSYRNGKGYFGNAKIGIDYYLNAKTTLGTLVDFNNWNGDMQSTGLTNITETIGGTSTQNSLIPDAFRKMNNQNLNANLNLKHNFNEQGKEMTVDLDYSRFANTANQDFDTRYYDTHNGQGNIYQNLIQQNIAPSYIDILAARIDYVLPTESKFKYEFGAKSSYVKTDNDFIFTQLVDGNWQNDPGKTNHFIYTEWVNAAYLNVGKQWEKTGFQGGLRAEYTQSEGYSVTLDQTVPQSYLSLFPTFFVNRQLAKNHALRYSYSRRIGRPNYQQLNPFLFFLDPYTFEKGNEYLKPEFTDNTELTYTYKNAASLAIGYGHTHNSMFQVIEQNDTTRVTYQTTRNLQKNETWSANFSFPIPVFKWWNMHNNLSVYYTHYYDPNVSGGVLDIGQAAYNFYTGNTFTLKKDWSAEANMWFNSPNQFGIIRSTKAQYAINVGIQKSFLNKKARVKLNANDLFLTSFFNGKIDYENIDLAITNRWSSRRANLSFTYNFGNQNVKASRRRTTATDDLKNRVGGQQN